MRVQQVRQERLVQQVLKALWDPLELMDYKEYRELLALPGLKVLLVCKEIQVAPAPLALRVLAAELLAQPVLPVVRVYLVRQELQEVPELQALRDRKVLQAQLELQEA